MKFKVYDIFIFLYDYLKDQPHLSLKQKKLDSSVILETCAIGTSSKRQGKEKKRLKDRVFKTHIGP